MLKNYLKITIRNLTKNKLFSTVNILGLTIGITCFILIALFVLDELTYDSFNTKADRIFRLNSHYKVGDDRFNLANSPMPLADALTSEYPEIEKAARVLPANNIYVKKGNDYIKEERFFYADSSLFDIFSIVFLRGNPKTALTQPNSIVITSNAAAKYFSSENPVGKRINLSNGMEFLITGVVKPVPENSHFEFNFIASLNSIPEKAKANWFGQFVHTYVLTSKGVTVKELNKKIYKVAEKHLGPIIKICFRSEL
jgi:putative ABC transport system permease protein